MSIKPKEWINDLPEYIAGRTIEEIKEKYGLKDVYKLASNENILGPCPQVRDYLKTAVTDINYYPDAEACITRAAVAKHYGVDKDNVIMGNGTDQIIEMLCDCFIDLGDNIVTSDPNFVIYEKATLKCGGQVKKIPLLKDSFKQDIERTINTVDKRTRVIFLTSPHNPSGTIITADEFDRLVSAVKKINISAPSDVIIVMDEAYCEYAEKKDIPDTISYIIENSNIITLRTFSKIFGLAGLRIGYGIASREMISALNKIRLPFNTSLVSQRAAARAMENYWYAESVRNTISDEKEKFYREFKNMGVEFIKSYANFILVRLGNNCAEIIEKLLQKGFIIRPGINLGIPDYARITMSTPEINKKFLKNFKSIYLSL